MTRRPLFLLPSLLALTAAHPGCQRRPPPAPAPPAAAPAGSLDAACRDIVGAPRVERLSPRLFLAIGHDLANVILVRTGDGNVIIDAAMSPARARPIRDALLAAAPGPVRMVILTHSHLDHTGGASVFAGPGVPIVATRAFPDEFLRQYGLSRRTEVTRGQRQFGVHVPAAELPCSAIGRRLDPAAEQAAAETGARLPTRTFSGHERIVHGGVTFDLYEAPGETADQLFVHIPEEQAVLPGDNFYWAFPNLYTLRGGAARPISAWIDSLDRMRALSPALLVPSHTLPVQGAPQVAAALRDYRDAIQWVRDEAVRGAAAAEPLEQLAARVRLPPHLRDSPYLQERYGQVDWSVRAIYQSQVGWFDGQAERLYPLPAAEAARREVALLGGPAAVLQRAAAACAADGDDELRWGLHLLAKLRDSGQADGALAPRLTELTATAYHRLGLRSQNSNGRAYLLSRALELRGGAPPVPPPRPDEVLLRDLPLRTFFQGMAPLVRPATPADPPEESVAFALTEEGGAGARFTVTIRRGVAEVIEGPPLPGTPPPLATVKASGMTWRRLALRLSAPLGALVGGDLQVEGSLAGLRRFLARFDTQR